MPVPKKPVGRASHGRTPEPGHPLPFLAMLAPEPRVYLHGRNFASQHCRRGRGHTTWHGMLKGQRMWPLCRMACLLAKFRPSTVLWRRHAGVWWRVWRCVLAHGAWRLSPRHCVQPRLRRARDSRWTRACCVRAARGMHTCGRDANATCCCFLRRDSPRVSRSVFRCGFYVENAARTGTLPR